MIKVECGEFGSFSYVKPNIPQGIRLASFVFPNKEDIASQADLATLMTSKCIEHQAFLVKSVDIKIGEKEIKNYSDMLDEYDLIKYVMEMTEAILDCLDVAIKKKNG